MAQDYHSQFRMTEVPVIIIISGAVLLVVMFLIFAKRQIMRFTLRGRRVQSLDDSVPKVIRREIDRRLDCVQKVVHEPRLIPEDKHILRNGSSSLSPYYYRQRAVDDVKWLEKEITKQVGCGRLASDNLRSYLLTQLKGSFSGGGGGGGAAVNGQQRLIHQFCDMYEHARHDPAQFGSYEYESYNRMLLKLVDAAKSLKLYTNASPKKSNTKTTNKTPALLDPARLRPPQLISGERTGGEQGRLNMSLGIQQHQQRQEDTENEDDPFHRIERDREL